MTPEYRMELTKQAIMLVFFDRYTGAKRGPLSKEEIYQELEARGYLDMTEERLDQETRYITALVEGK